MNKKNLWKEHEMHNLSYFIKTQSMKTNYLSNSSDLKIIKDTKTYSQSLYAIFLSTQFCLYVQEFKALNQSQNIINIIIYNTYSFIFSNETILVQVKTFKHIV